MSNGKTSHLAQITIEDGKTSIRAYRQIDMAEKYEIEHHINAINRFFSSQHVTEAVIANRNELAEAIVKMGVSFLDSPDHPYLKLDRGLFNISRLLGNLCSIFRSFLDHNDRFLLKEFGVDSKPYLTFKELRSKAYDVSKSYRIFEHMRNYIQHYDMPPISGSTSQSRDEPGVQIRVDLNLSEMSKDPKFSKKIKIDTESGDNLFPVLNLIEDWEKSFFEISDYCKSIRKKSAENSAQFILMMRTKDKIDNRGDIAIVLLPEPQKDAVKLLNMRISVIPAEKAKILLDNIG